jgi:hypothetical protein
MGPDYRDHGLVFQQPDGTPWRPDWISRQFEGLMRISGAAVVLPAMPSLKSMRSTAVTNLHDEGVALEVIANVTGHVDETVAYLAVTAESTRQGFEILAKRLRPRRSDRRPRTAVPKEVSQP